MRHDEAVLVPSRLWTLASIGLDASVLTHLGPFLPQDRCRSEPAGIFYRAREWNADCGMLSSVLVNSTDGISNDPSIGLMTMGHTDPSWLSRVAAGAYAASRGNHVGCSTYAG